MYRRSLFIFALLCCVLVLLVGYSPATKAQGAISDPQPVSLAIVYDTSVGLNGYPNVGRDSFGRKKALFAALTDFISLESPQNEYVVIHFNTVPYQILDGTIGTEPVLKAIKKLSSVQRDGSTSLFDACLLAIRTIAKGRYNKRAIILMSDGIETTSNSKIEDVTRALSDSKIVLYAINIGRPDKNPNLDYYRPGNEVLNKLAIASNGMLFHLEEYKDQITIFQTIAAKLHGNTNNTSQ